MGPSGRPSSQALLPGPRVHPWGGGQPQRWSGLTQPGGSGCASGGEAAVAPEENQAVAGALVGSGPRLVPL